MRTLGTVAVHDTVLYGRHVDIFTACLGHVLEDAYGREHNDTPIGKEEELVDQSGHPEPFVVGASPLRVTLHANTKLFHVFVDFLEHAANTVFVAAWRNQASFCFGCLVRLVVLSGSVT